MKFRMIMALTVLIGLSGLVACGGVEGRKQKYLEQAEASFQKGDFEKARINFKNVLQIDPKDIKGREGFARTLEKLQDWRGAVAQYRAIVEENPANSEAKIKLGQLYLLAKASDLALTLAEEVLSANATHDGALALKAASQLQQGDVQNATLNAEQAYKLNSASIDNIVLLASIYGSQQRSDDAIQLLENELKNHPDSSSIQILLSQLYLATDRKALAEQSMLKLIELNPEEIAYKSQLARFYQGNGRGAEAEALLTKSVSQEPTNLAAVVALEQFYLLRKEANKAEAALKKSVNNNPEDAEFSLHLAAFYIAQQKQELARAIYTDLLSRDTTVMLKAKNRLAYMASREGKTDEALRLIGEVLVENPADVEALTLRGGIALGRRQAVDAINDLRAVLNATPDSPDIIKMLGQAHRLNGEKQQAVEMFKAALNLQPNDVDLRINLADLLLEMKEINQAARQLEMANQMAPNNTIVLEKRVNVYLQGQYLDDADQVVEQLRRLIPQSPRNSYYAGLIAQARNRHEDALKAFDESLSLKSGALEPVTAKVKSYIALQRIDDAIVWLDAEIVKNADNPALYNLVGELRLAKKSWSSAQQAFDHAIQMKPDWWIPYRNMALLLRNKNNDRDAYTYLQTVVDTVDSIPLRIELANYAERLQEYDAAITQYEKVLAARPDNKIIVNNLAMLIVTHKSDEASLMRAAQLSAQLEGLDVPSFLDTAGWVHAARGDYQAALPMIQQAARGAPEDPSIQYHLALVYWETSDSQNATRYLEKALASEKPFSGREKAEALLAKIKAQS